MLLRFDNSLVLSEDLRISLAQLLVRPLWHRPAWTVTALPLFAAPKNEERLIVATPRLIVCVLVSNGKPLPHVLGIFDLIHECHREIFVRDVAPSISVNQQCIAA